MHLKGHLSRVCLAWLILLAIGVLLLPMAARALEPADHVIINQVYGGSDDGAASHSFIELYNPTGEAQDLSNWSVQYRSSEDGDHDTQWYVKELSGTIAAGGYYLIRCGAIDNPEEADYQVPAGDVEWEVQLHNKGLSVVLMSATQQLDTAVTGNYEELINKPEGVVDIAAVQGNDEEDSQQPPLYEGGYSAYQSKKNAIRRDNFADTDNNAEDFVVVDYSAAIVGDMGPHNSKGDGPVSADAKLDGYENTTADLSLEKIAGYSAGVTNVDGGVMEIVAYNSQTRYAYAVNGQSGMLDCIPLSGVGSQSNLTGEAIDVKTMVENTESNFTYGDMTSVAVSPDGTKLAVALQAEGYSDAGRVAIFTCEDDGTLTLEKLVTVGVQPDMVTFADNNTVLTADEGEPREGYGEGVADPKGSVSIVDVNAGTATVVTFDSFDDERASLVENNIVLKKDTAPSVDLEPEYIAVLNGYAYVTLQENNAIAVLDIDEGKFTGIYSCGFEDYSVTPVDINKKDDAYEPRKYEGLMGIRMPDGIAAFEIGGVTYLVTANEGDAREWGEDETEYLNETEIDFEEEGAQSPAGNIKNEDGALEGKVVFFGVEDEEGTGYDGLVDGVDYLFGGRSFTVYQVSDDAIAEIYTSGSEFESMTAEYLPEYYNCSNDNAVLDDRSGKKGVEAESITVGEIDGKTYAFIALERIGGIMVYDVTNPASPSYVNYINTRDFDDIIPGSAEYDGGELDKWVTGGDVAPEGLYFIPASASPTDSDLLLAACEVSGTVAVYELTYEEDTTPIVPGQPVNPGTPVTPEEPDEVQLPFTDVEETAWYYEAVSFVYAENMMNGVDSDSFDPNGQMTRGMVMTVLARLAGESTEVGSPWYQPGVDWAVENGVSDGSDPTGYVTREQFVTMLWRYAGSPVSTGDITSFADDEAVSSWAQDAMEWAVVQGIIDGTDGNRLDPQGETTRAQTAKIFMEYLSE